MGRHRPTRLVATIWWRLDRTRITPACRRHRSRKPALAAEYGTTPAQLALAWLLHQSPQILLIPGTTSIGHLEDNMHAAEIKLDDRRMAAIADAGRPVEGGAGYLAGAAAVRSGRLDYGRSGKGRLKAEQKTNMTCWAWMISHGHDLGAQTG